MDETGLVCVVAFVGIVSFCFGFGAGWTAKEEIDRGDDDDIIDFLR